MSQNKTTMKSFSSCVAIEVIHLFDHRKDSLKVLDKIHINLNELKDKSDETVIQKIGKDLLSKVIVKCLEKCLRELSDNIGLRINSLKLETNSPIDKTSSLRHYYEECGLFKFGGCLQFEYYGTRKTGRALIKKFWTQFCENNCFRNTNISLIDENYETIKFLSNINRLIPRITFEIKSFSFGTIIDLTNFVEHYNSESCGKSLKVAKGNNDLITDFQTDHNSMKLKFRLTSGGKDKHLTSIRYKLEYDYKQINSMIVSIDNQVMKVYFTLTNPPILYKLYEDTMTPEEKVEYHSSKQWSDKRKPFYKRKQFKIVESDIGVHSDDVQNHHNWIRDNCFGDCEPQIIGKCNVLMIEIPLIVNENKLKDNYRDLADPYCLLYLMKRFARIPVYISRMERQVLNEIDLKTKLYLKLSKNLSSEERFSVEYAFQALFSHTFQSSDELRLNNQLKEFLDLILQLLNDLNCSQKVNIKAMEETLFEMLAVSERKSIYRTINALKKIFQEYQQMNETIEKEKVVNLNSFHTELENIRRCILTPTRLLILPPQPTLTSRFIVNAKADYAIRLSIREDTLESLQFTVQSQRHFLPLQKKAISDFLKRTIKTPIEDSIRIGDRYFKFLGSSSSSLRDAGMILYAKDPDGTTAQLIRENIGEMSHIRKNVAKYVARLGLAFSQVMKHIIVNPNSNETEVINDIEGDFKVDENGDKLDEKYNFSDGIGRVSIDIMKEVYKELPNECTNKPSAMQIRYGGCKGMLVLDPKLKGRKILFRESMQKYKSDAKELGIIKLSLPRSLYLNRPFITILEQLGVESNIFLKMLMKDLKGLSNAMICECAATPLLRSHSTLGIPYTKLLKYGIPFLSEPIFRQIVDSVINHRIVELKRKARIKVPMNSGRTVFGVLDETSTLEYGQVFVQLSEVDEDNMPQDKTFILKEKIMVTKFPCLHPGDVRKFEAIDVPELHHIKDCIVFPQKGSRPHPDEMAGSDLDGDEYAVIWQSNLIFENENNKPMIFPTTKAKELHKEADVSDILDFYCDYIICNNVGVLANAHLANADLKDKGIFDDICMKLAHKYAVSLDFAKTGQTEELETKERPKLYPDFMEKFAQKRSYLSNKTLGQIYRYCDRYSLGIYSNRNLEIKAEPNPTFILEGWQRYEESAKNAYQTYKLKVMFLLNRFGLDNEATLLSGTFSKTTKYMTGRNETNDVHELLENMINKLFIEFKDRFNFESTNDNDSEDERRLRASAWYVVPFNADVGINERYFGFSWTITEELCKLHKDNDKFNVNKVDHKCIHLMTNFIDKYFYDNYIYRDPVIDNSITDVEKRRLIEMRSRLESAEVVLRAWLERQDHLFFKRNIKKKLISSTDYVISDMDRKLRRKFTQMRCLEMEIATKCLTKPLKTSGQLIMTFFKEAVDEWLNIDNNRRIVDTPLIKFGFSALMTLYHFFKTREISHIIDLRPKFTISLQSPVRELSFFISLDIPMPRKSQQNKDEKIKPKSSAESKLEFAINKRQEQRIELMKKYVEYMVVNSDQFIEKLKFISGAIEIYLEPYPLKTKRVQHYYLLTASGTVWSLQTIKNFISHPSFFNTVVNHDIPWKRKNLFYKGDPALESIAEIKS